MTTETKRERSDRTPEENAAVARIILRDRGRYPDDMVEQARAILRGPQDDDEPDDPSIGAGNGNGARRGC